MNLNETKKDLNPEIKKELEKSKLEVLTNENDILVKNLKKAGWSTWAFKYFSKNKLFKKGCDWIIANNVKTQLVFGSNYNQVSFITKNKVEYWRKMKKSEVAKKITKKIVNFFKKVNFILISFMHH